MWPQIPNVFIELTNHCNFHCAFCASDLQQRSRGYMQFALVERIFQELAQKGIARQVALHVLGEPMLHPRFFDVLACAHTHRINIVLNTNASLLSPDTIDRVLSELKGPLLLSLQTPSEETYRCRGARELAWADYRAKIALAIRAYLSRRARGIRQRNAIEIHLLDTSQVRPRVNVISTPEAAAHAVSEWVQITASTERELGLPAHPRDPIQKSALLGREPPGVTYCLQSGLQIRFKGATTFANAVLPAGSRLVYGPPQECPAPFEQLAILWNGDCSVCCTDFDGDLVIGSLLTASIEDIWLGREASLLRDSMRGAAPMRASCRRCQAVIVSDDGMR